MIVYGFCKGYQYTGDGTLQLQVRIPSIHGPFKPKNGVKNYTKDADLPWIPSVLLPNFPNDGDVVMLQSVDEGKGSDFVVLGLTGASYSSGYTAS